MVHQHGHHGPGGGRGRAGGQRHRGAELQPVVGERLGPQLGAARVRQGVWLQLHAAAEGVVRGESVGQDAADDCVGVAGAGAGEPTAGCVL